MTAADAVHEQPATVHAEDPLDESLEALGESGRRWLPVLEDGRFLGVLTTQATVQTYKRFLRRGVRRTAGLDPSTQLFEATVLPSSPLDGRTLADVKLPAESLVVSIRREGEVIFPRAETRLAAGDVLLVATSQAGSLRLSAFLARHASTASTETSSVVA
jgi:hypothetical protein